jgi:hypothetical protein
MYELCQKLRVIVQGRVTAGKPSHARDPTPLRLQAADGIHACDNKTAFSTEVRRVEQSRVRMWQGVIKLLATVAAHERRQIGETQRFVGALGGEVSVTTTGYYMLATQTTYSAMAE